MEVVLVAVLLVTFIDSVVLSDSDKQELISTQAKVRVIQRLLGAKCPSYSPSSRPTDKLSDLEAEEEFYELLKNDLIVCQVFNPLRERIPKNTSSLSLLPKECSTATDLNEVWRLDHDSGNHRPGGLSSSTNYACDHRKTLQWFRFSGAGGNRMLDSCPKWFSCGGRYPYWTDELMPKDIGVSTAVSVYGVVGNDCKHVSRQMEVMRCSWRNSHDLIYRYRGVYYRTCSNTFCGRI